MSNLIVFFSREGNNYVNGSIKNLKVDNIEVVANMIHKIAVGAAECDTVRMIFIKSALMQKLKKDLRFTELKQ